MKKALLRVHRFLLPPNPWIGWTPYLWLIYLGFFYIKFFFVTPPWPEILATILATGVFLYLYFSGYWRKGSRLIFNVVGIAAIGVVMAPINTGAGVFFIYAGAFTPFAGSGRTALSLLAGLLALVALEALVFNLNAGFWLPAGIITPLVALANYHFVSMARKEQALKRSQEEVERLATVAERERIGRDLHDLLGHTLSVIALKSELARKLLQRDPVAAEDEIREVEEVSRHALKEVREAVTGYRSLGLKGEAEHARSALKSAGIQCELHLNGVKPPPALENTLALALREGVTNVIRHSNATQCRIEFVQDENTITMKLRDDGQGGDYRDGSGLAGMRERVRALNGRMGIEAKQGTSLRVSLPLDQGESAP